MATQATNPISLLTVPEACKALALSRSFLYKLMQAGQIKSVRLGRSRRISLEEIRRFVERAESDCEAVQW